MGLKRFRKFANPVKAVSASVKVLKSGVGAIAKNPILSKVVSVAGVAVGGVVVGGVVNKLMEGYQARQANKQQQAELFPSIPQVEEAPMDGAPISAQAPAQAQQAAAAFPGAPVRRRSFWARLFGLR